MIIQSQQSFMKVMESVTVECNRAYREHSTLPADPLRRTAIVVEEAGEALQEALDLTRPSLPIRSRHLVREQLRIELTQTAAAAINVLVAMEEEDRQDTGIES